MGSSLRCIPRMDEPNLGGAIPTISVAWFLNLSKRGRFDDDVNPFAATGRSLHCIRFKIESKPDPEG
jgi:hypothetical protein